jgi:predicted phage-related endonuclease
MKYSSKLKKAFVNEEQGIIYFARLSIEAKNHYEAAHPNSFMEKLQSQLKDLNEIIKEAERTKKEIETELNNLNQKNLF